MRLNLLLLLALLAAPLGDARAAAAAAPCAGALAPRLEAGQSARVSMWDAAGNNLRTSPDSFGIILGVLSDGEIFDVVAGPECSEGAWWWQAQRIGGEVGWTVEGVRGEYWLEPYPLLAPASRRPAPAAVVQPVAWTVDPPAQPVAPAARLAYLRYDPAAESLTPYTLDLATGVETPLGVIQALDNVLRWSPDGSALALVGADGELYALDALTGAATHVTNSPDAVEVWPSWSPDSRRLAFSAPIPDAAGENFEIFTVLLPAGEPLNLTEHPALDQWPAWSPDGTRIAFASDRGGSMDIYVMSAADGANPVRLSAMPTLDTRPTWSPDSLSIAFQAEDERGGSLIYVVSADGASVLPVSPAGVAAHSPVWSPGGQQLVFVGGSPDDPALETIYVVDRSGSNLRPALDTPTLVRGVTWVGGLNWLIASLNLGNGYDLVALDPATGQQAVIAATPDDDELWPRMQPGVVERAIFQLETGAPTPAVNAGPRDLLLIYDPLTPVFTLQNVSEGPLNLAPLSFTGAGRTVQADIWAPYTASPLGEFKAFGCVMIWKYGLPDQAAPPECGDARQAWVSDNTYIFWTGESFTVNYNGAPVATCLSATGRCEVDLP